MGLPGIDSSGPVTTIPEPEKRSASTVVADEPTHDVPTDVLVEESSSDRLACGQSVEMVAGGSADWRHTESETAQGSDGSRTESLSVGKVTVPGETLDEGELTQDASKAETVVAASLCPLPHADETAVENDVPVLDLAEATEEEDEEAEPATKLQWICNWLRMRRRQLTGTAVSVVVHFSAAWNSRADCYSDWSDR